MDRVDGGVDKWLSHRVFIPVSQVRILSSLPDPAAEKIAASCNCLLCRQNYTFSLQALSRLRDKNSPLQRAKRTIRPAGGVQKQNVFYARFF